MVDWAEETLKVRTLLLVFVALLILLLSTVALHYVNLGEFNFVASMTIAIFKTLLIVFFFMRVGVHDRLITLAALASLLWLGLLLGLTMADVMTRQ